MNHGRNRKKRKFSSRFRGACKSLNFSDYASWSVESSEVYSQVETSSFFVPSAEIIGHTYLSRSFHEPELKI